MFGISRFQKPQCGSRGNEMEMLVASGLLTRTFGALICTQKTTEHKGNESLIT